MKFPLLVATLACCSLTPGFGAPILAHVDVYRSGTDGYHTFRIPVVETAADGTLVAFAAACLVRALDVLSGTLSL